MEEFNKVLLKQLYIPPLNSHKGQNGKLLIIGGSHLFHAAPLWALKVSSRIVDMVYFSSIDENNEIVKDIKCAFKDGIVVRRGDLDNYIKEADCILVGPGMMRNSKFKIQNSKLQLKIQNLSEVENLEDEGEQTYFLTKYLLANYPNKKFVIDAGALQMMEADWLLWLKETPILTPHQKEYETLEFKVQNSKFKIAIQNSKLQQKVEYFVKEYNCLVLLKGVEDEVCSTEKCVVIKGGNPGMTKGGTGDVLAGLVASLYCKNDAFVSAACGSYINKVAGDELFKKVGPYFNASDLADEIPKVMKELIFN